MIRIALGFFIALGAVGADDFALASGQEFPPLLQTLGLALFGLALAAWGVAGIQQVDKR